MKISKGARRLPWAEFALVYRRIFETLREAPREFIAGYRSSSGWITLIFNFCAFFWTFQTIGLVLRSSSPGWFPLTLNAVGWFSVGMMASGFCYRGMAEQNRERFRKEMRGFVEQVIRDEISGGHPPDRASMH